MLHGRGSRLGAIVVALLLVMCFAGAAHAAGPYNVNNDPATTGDTSDATPDGGSRVLEVNPDATATLNGVTLEGGYIDSCGDPDGGGINVNPGDSGTTSLTLNKSRVTRNVIACDGDGGGIRAGTDTAVALNG